MTVWWPPVASSCMGNPQPARVKPVVTMGEEIPENITRGPANELLDGERSGKNRAGRYRLALLGCAPTRQSGEFSTGRT